MSRTICCMLAVHAFAFSLSAAAQQSVTLTSVRDNTLYQSTSGNVSNGIGTGMFAGRTDDSSRRRAVMAFDLGAIPAGATIQSAQVRLTMTQTNSNSTPISLHRILASWGEGTSNATSGGGGGGATATANDATWVHRFWSGTSWTSPGGQFTAAPSATLPVGGTGTYTWGSTTQLVADVQGWLANPASNFGLIAIGDESQDQTAKRFATREAATASTRPALLLTYTTATAASVASTGTGCVGISGLPLALGTVGLPVLGNAAFALTISGGAAGAPAYVFHAVGLEPAPVTVGGCPVWLNVASLFATAVSGASPFGPFILNGNGASTVPVPIPNQPALAGMRIDAQVWALDSLATGSRVTSNALTVVLGL